MIIFDLDKLPAEHYVQAGGKAKGLAGLFKAGLRVAKGFVIIGAETDSDFEEAADRFMSSGIEQAAVRSSAIGEDGADFSGAGQYSTYLNVSGREEFINAAKNCVASLKNRTAESYSDFFSSSKSAAMSIVVQQMVDARAAGVCFTVNPVTGSTDMLIEAVKGLGESLVSGQKAADSAVVPLKREGGLIVPDLSGVTGSGVLTADMAADIAKGACTALKYFKYELDMEWAVGLDGGIIWLQARPITASCEADIDELDTKYGDKDTVFTRCNVGEMLPGAVTPLSLSTTVLAIDNGLRRMLVKAGTYKSLKKIPENSCIANFSNHLFFNLTTIYKMSATVIGAAKNQIELNICGKYLDTPEPAFKKINFFRRLWNGKRYFGFLMSRKKARRKMDKLCARFKIEKSGDITEYYDNITDSFKGLNDSLYYHYITSSHSGAMNSTLTQIIQGKDGSSEDAKAVVAGLLENIDDIESVDILRSMRRIAREALTVNPDANSLDTDGLKQMIDGDNGALKAAYDNFIARHGHRSIREAELRSRSWAADPSLYGHILMLIKTGATEPQRDEDAFKRNLCEFMKGKKGIGKKLLGYLVNQSRAGVVNREYTKSGFIRITDRIKDAYIGLAQMLTDAKALPDTDLIYFLTHEELGRLIKNREAGLVKKALRRRRMLEIQKEIKYSEVYTGFPTPLELDEAQSGVGGVLSGAPISRGEVCGTARVVKSEEDAKSLQKGEIMIASFTDIGWSPYYAIIGGLVTEVGSALSHGAVVAREYALPLVVNVADATRLINTGDTIRLNASRGTVTILEKAM